MRLQLCPQQRPGTAPKQTIHQARRARAPRTPRKPPVREIMPRTVDWSL